VGKKAGRLSDPEGRRRWAKLIQRYTVEEILRQKSGDLVFEEKGGKVTTFGVNFRKQGGENARAS